MAMKRINDVVIYGNVETDLTQIRQLFAQWPEKIIARCEPGVCTFDFNGISLKAYGEVINGRFLEEVIDKCKCEHWWSEHFFIQRESGVLKLIAIRGRDNLITKASLLGAVMLLPPRLIERLNALTPEEAHAFMLHLLPKARALCPDMIVFGTGISLPVERHEELMRILSKVGTLDAVLYECAEGGDICGAETGGCCEIYEEQKRQRVELWTDCSRFDCRRICMLAVLL